METVFYPPFSERRHELRKDWHNSTIKDWKQFLELAEYRAIRVADALNKSINKFTHKQILDTYVDLYKDENR
jgi:hypothetical protein